MGKGSYRFMNSWTSTLFKKAYFVSQLYLVAEAKLSYQLFPLGDSAITIDLGNCIDEQLNRHALALYDWLEAHRFPGVLDIIVAYSSVSVFFDPLVIRASGLTGPDAVSEWVGKWLERAWREAEAGGAPQPDKRKSDGWSTPEAEGSIISIPVCYEREYAPDLDLVARAKELSGQEVVAIHSVVVYRVYMVGFLPGFSYMGIVDERIQLVRKPQPVPVVAGGVGIAGMQTGIYPLNSPGGWQIIGRTPMRFFDVGEHPPVRLKTGDRVRFCPISTAEFRRLSGRPR
jgi:inhibitor of KinA